MSHVLYMDVSFLRYLCIEDCSQFAIYHCVLACGKRQSRAAQDFAMSDFSLTSVLQIKTSKNFNGMANLDKIPEL